MSSDAFSQERILGFHRVKSVLGDVDPNSPTMLAAAEAFNTEWQRSRRRRIVKEILERPDAAEIVAEITKKLKKRSV
jgi:hypothetical protein